MDVEVRPATADEYLLALAPIFQFFGHRPDEEARARFEPLIGPERTAVAWADGVPVGGSAAFPFRLSVPGGEVDAAGVTMVGVSPTHRRRGILRRMMTAQLEAAHERGEAVATLFASEGGIYGRFGYGLAALLGQVELERAHGALRGTPVPGATVRQVTREEAAELFPPIHEAVRRIRPGMPSRSADWWRIRPLDDPEWARRGGGVKMYVVAELDGRPAGYALYRHHLDFDHGNASGKVHVIEALGDCPEAVDTLWRYLIAIDWVASVTADLLPVDHELHLMLEQHRRLRYAATEGLWVRLVDVGAALGARTYTGEDAVVLDVADSVCAWNAGVWRVGGGGCERTDAAPELRLDVRELGSAYLGGFTFSELARARLVEELAPGALTRADRLFAAAAKPWCPEIF